MAYATTKEVVFKILNRLAREKRCEAERLERRIGDRPEKRKPKLACRRLREAEADYRKLRQMADDVHFDWNRKGA